MRAYDVVWERWAEDALIELWTSSVQKAVVTKAVDRIDRMLQSEPQEKGVEISEGLRRLHVAPLVVIFWIDSDATRVTVDLVRLARESDEPFSL